MKASRFALLLLAAGLAACGSDPSVQDLDAPRTHFDAAKQPYWEDPRWAKQLLAAIQSVVRDPVDPDDRSTPGLHGVVKFTFLEGNIQYPEIVQGTGNPDNDQLMLRQVASAQVPAATGVDSDAPHVFVLELDMPTPFESFEYSVFAAIDNYRVYPKEALLAGAKGTTDLGFDYLDGKVSDVSVTHSSNNHYLDKASTTAVAKASLPPPPPAYAGKTLHMEMAFCYSLNGSNCPAVRNLISVHGTLIGRRSR